MRKFIGIAMPVLLILVVVTGIVESQEFHAGRPPEAHIFMAVLFIVVMCIHAWLNRKALIRYYSGSKKC
ncbi:MAG: hypothetical protein WC566_01870 [Dehalococcoidia bacterium]